MELLFVHVVRAGQWCLVGVAGELDVTSVHVFDRTLDEAMADESLRYVVVDMTDVTFMSSVGLRSLMAARIRMETEGELRIVAPAGSPVHRVLQVSGLEPLLSPYPTASAATVDVTLDVP